MSKIMLVFLGAIVLVLLLSGMVEVKINPQKYVDIPGVANSVLKEKATLEKARSYLVDLKRRAELFVVRDKEKSLVLSLLYVRTDSIRLKELVARKLPAAALLPQAELLVHSIDLVRANAEKAPAEVVAHMKADSVESFTLAHEALGGLQEQYKEYEEIHSEFTRLTASLEEQIGNLGIKKEENKPDVAGVKDQPSSEPPAKDHQETKNEIDRIPLKF